MNKLYSHIYDCAMGTCRSEAEIAELCGVAEEEVLELLADARVERCKGCDWWFEDGELDGCCDTCAQTIEDAEGYCMACRENMGTTTCWECQEEGWMVKTPPPAPPRGAERGERKIGGNGDEDEN